MTLKTLNSLLISLYHNNILKTLFDKFTTYQNGHPCCQLRIELIGVIYFESFTLLAWYPASQPFCNRVTIFIYEPTLPEIDLTLFRKTV